MKRQVCNDTPCVFRGYSRLINIAVVKATNPHKVKFITPHPQVFLVNKVNSLIKRSTFLAKRVFLSYIKNIVISLKLIND